MAALTTSIEHCTEGSRDVMQQRKDIKDMQPVKGEIKLPVFIGT